MLTLLNIAGYACALIGDILLQGHLYVTENYLGFHSNVFGYVTRVKLSYESRILLNKFYCLDTNSFDLGDLYHKGEDGQDHTQRGGGVHRGRDPHLHLPHLKGRHLQGDDQGLEKGRDQE